MSYKVLASAMEILNQREWWKKSKQKMKEGDKSYPQHVINLMKIDSLHHTYHCIMIVFPTLILLLANLSLKSNFMHKSL